MGSRSMPSASAIVRDCYFKTEMSMRPSRRLVAMLAAQTTFPIMGGLWATTRRTLLVLESSARAPRVEALEFGNPATVWLGTAVLFTLKLVTDLDRSATHSSSSRRAQISPFPILFSHPTPHN